MFAALLHLDGRGIKMCKENGQLSDMGRPEPVTAVHDDNVALGWKVRVAAVDLNRQEAPE
jgi:hypothetical protein